jgi:hypothetical protein
MKLQIAPISLAALLFVGLARAQTPSASTSSSAGFSSGILGGSTQAPRSSSGTASEYGPESATTSSHLDGSARVVAFITTGLGIGGIGVGTAFGVTAIARKVQSDKSCDVNNVCNHTALSLQHAGQTDGNIATASLAGGAALLGTGILLFVAPPRAFTSDQGAVKVHLAISPSSFAIVGSF